MLERHIQKRQAPKVYAVVGDGFSEKIYFEKLKAAERLRNITIKPELPNRSGKGGGFVRVFKKAEELHQQGYDRVYCLIDFDTVLSENKVSSYNLKKARLEQKGVIVLESNPCFEIWLLLHFQRTGRAFTDCNEVGHTIRQNHLLSDYEKSQQYHQRKDLYSALKPLLCSNAVVNAQFLEQDRHIQNAYYPRCQIFKLICDLGICACDEILSKPK